MNTLTVPRALLENMIDQARSAAPVEACGILSGRDGRAATCHRMSNADNSPDHFTMAPQEQFAVTKKIRKAGEETLAIYHSHPASPARPSAEDLRLALTPGVVYAILSLQDAEKPVLKGFRIEGETVAEIPLHIVD